jgi:shikimate kinase
MCFAVKFETLTTSETIKMLITLIGYRATGKTTLAKLLAKRLQWDWIDSDVEIERRAKKNIARIFADSGEPAFRDLEAKVITDLCKYDGLIIASGGGAPLRKENRDAMRKNGKVVWLTAKPETILARMSGDATTAQRRPNLTDKGPLDEIVQLLAQREPVYKETAHLVVDTENRTPDELADEILQGLKMFPRPLSEG